MTLNAEMKRAMERVSAGLPTKSAKIRKLAAAGYAKADIARFLDIRYQHVRNVLLHAVNKPDVAPAPEHQAVHEAREEVAAFVAEGSGEAVRVYRFNVDSEGRIKLPQEALAALDATPGGLITARFEDGELKLMNIEASVRFVQALAAPYIKPGEGNWSDQLVAERCEEAAREAAEDSP